MANISEELQAWDGKSVSDLQQIFVAHHSEVDFSSELEELCLDDSLSVGGTWLVKHYVESGGKFNRRQQQIILSRLPGYEHWQSQLHILQALSYFTISDESRKVLEPFLRYGLSDTNKFIKAWCFNGLYELAVQYPELQSEVSDLLNLALKHEPASVKARVRNLLKKGF